MLTTILRAALLAGAAALVPRPAALALAAARLQATDDPALRAAVERFFATQEAEDIPGYLGLWSPTAQRPQPAQLQYVFDAGDDKFTGITILRVTRAGDRVRARVAAHRVRTAPRRGGGAPITIEMDLTVSLTYVKEDDDWKLVREGPAADDLAAALLEAGTAAARKELLDNDADLVGEALISAL